MAKAGRRQVSRKRKKDGLKELQHTLLDLHDELSETMAWTALLCDGLCGILSERAEDIDSATHNGLRFAAAWLKRRNEKHDAMLQAANTKVREIRERQ